MAAAPSTQELAQQFATRGAFNAILENVKKGAISTETASQWIAQLFTVYSSKVDEAKREVRHLDLVLQRLAHVTQQGAHPRPYEDRLPLLRQLSQELTTFDNWVVSLMETDLTMIWLAAPERARAKPQELAKAMAALTQKRIDQQKLSLNAPDLFSAYRG
jgi:hypothetical protein